MLHASDCAVFNEPAYPKGDCDCGGLHLAEYRPEAFRPTLIAGPGRLGFFIDHSGGECFIEAHQLPADTLIAIAAAANLPDAHGLVAGSGFADSVDLHDAKEAVIAKFEALLTTQGFAGH